MGQSAVKTAWTAEKQGWIQGEKGAGISSKLPYRMLNFLSVKEK
jgi:hypothetical protein